MNASHASPRTAGAAGFAPVLARWILGAFFVSVGLSKALHPVEFLQLVRQYDIVNGPVLLDVVASLLPWFEIFCGLLLVVGLAVRGTALLLVGMLVPFTVLVFRQALVLHAAGGIPFCAIRFDCGCGTGPVFVCGKLTENLLLIVLSGALLCLDSSQWSIKFSIGKKRA